MKLWGGRFKKPTDKLVEQFTSSLPFDKRLYEHDIKGSLVHTSMLARSGLISSEEEEKIKGGLNEIYREIKENRFAFDIADEDIHMAIELALIEKIGPVGGKLHTARSRNDQVALDMRLYLKDEIVAAGQFLLALQQVLDQLVQESQGIIMPGYTHLQPAQPVFFSHHLMAYFFMFQRDFERLISCYKRTDSLPLGAAALAGTSLPIDQEFLAKQLGFSRIAENSMDAVSDRDFVAEFLAVSSLVLVHLSRLAEEVILWSSAEFGFVEIDDAYATGSSIMPQKKNPDVAELVRAKAGRVFGRLIALLTTLKALPLTYNRDLQEDKENLFDTVDTLKMSLHVFQGMLKTIKVNQEKMEQAARKGFLNATDLADYLVSKGLPFRQAHEMVGEMVKLCLEKGCRLEDLSLKEMQSFSHLFNEGVYQILDVQRSVESKKSIGGTSSESLKRQLALAKEYLEKNQTWLGGQSGERL